MLICIEKKPLILPQKSGHCLSNLIGQTKVHGMVVNSKWFTQTIFWSQDGFLA